MFRTNWTFLSRAGGGVLPPTPWLRACSIQIWHSYQKFEKCVYTRFTPCNLNLIWPVSDLFKVEKNKKPFLNRSLLILLLASYISIPYKIVWERLTVKFNVAVYHMEVIGSTNMWKFTEIIVLKGTLRY